MTVASDAVLLQARATQAVADAASGGGWLVGFDELRGAGLCSVWSSALEVLYLYVSLPAPQLLDGTRVAEVAQSFRAAFPAATDVRVSRLSRMFDRAGASSGEQPAFHYVVETDPEAGWADEIARWYDTEHMPGLAAVPGCVRARRYLNHDHGPLSYACYDLLTRETLGCEAWLAVRNTAWSSRARPHFTNTLRTMFELRHAELPSDMLQK